MGSSSRMRNCFDHSPGDAVDVVVGLNCSVSICIVVELLIFHFRGKHEVPNRSVGHSLPESRRGVENGHHRWSDCAETAQVLSCGADCHDLREENLVEP